MECLQQALTEQLEQWCREPNPSLVDILSVSSALGLEEFEARWSFFSLSLSLSGSPSISVLFWILSLIVETHARSQIHAPDRAQFLPVCAQQEACRLSHGKDHRDPAGPGLSCGEPLEGACCLSSFFFFPPALY